MAEREEPTSALYWDLEYSRNRGDGFTEIHCPECDEWSPREDWDHGKLDDTEEALMCPSCQTATGSDEGRTKQMVR